MSYTPEFKKAFNRIKAVLADDGPEKAKLAFRDEMLALGHHERLLNLYRVSDKHDPGWRKFSLNIAQQAVIQATKGSNRVIILKSRQLGITTLAGLISLDLALWESGRECGIMAHHRDLVGKIFQTKIRTPYNYFLKDWGHYYSPVAKFDNKNELRFADDGLGRSLNTSVSVATSFVGSTLSFLHISEAALIQKQDDLINSLKSVPDNGRIIAESTPNGRGGWFYETWQNFRIHQETAAYLGVFLPWWRYYPEQAVAEQYELEVRVDWEKEEKELLELLPIKESHLNWRRQCIQQNCNGDSDNFFEQYPSDDISCFLAGHNSFFPASLTTVLDKKASKYKKAGILMRDESKVILEENNTPVTFVWEEPNVSHQYVIGADIGAGIGRDASCAYVLDRTSGRFVGCLYGQINPVTMAHELFKLAKWYNGAYLCPEVNNHGLATVEELKNLQYYKFYKRKEFDNLTNKIERKIGFLTKSDSKLRITDNFKYACKRGDLIITDPELINEMSTFVQLSSKTGHSVRREALPGTNDDRVIAACLTWEMHKQLPDMSDNQSLIEKQDDTKFDPDTGFPV